MILHLYVARRALAAFLAALAGVVLLVLAIDFVDHTAMFVGEGWMLAALALYANKAAGVVYQMAPAALLLGAGVAASGLRATREYTAMRASGLGPWRVAAPIAVVAVLAGGALLVLQDVVGVRAEERAEEIKAFRFGRGGDLRRYQAAREPKRWFRSADGRRIYHLRNGAPDKGFEGVTVLELTPGFTIARRIDAARMIAAEGGAWVLEEVEDRTFAPDGSLRFETAAARRYAFDEPPGAFALVSGRPSQMRWTTLVQQIEVRRRLGQPVVPFELERDNRLAYPMSAVPGALLAIAVALRPNRRGHLSVALLESVGVTLVFWAAQAVSYALALSGRLPPALAAWAPNAVFLVVGAVAVGRAR